MLAYDESVPCLYQTQKDLIDRLDSTICRYNDEPVFVTYHELDKLNIWNMVGKQLNPIKTIKSNDPRFDISMTECTYMNFVYEERLVSRGMSNHNQVFYLSRNPSKYWKQGFSIQYCHTSSIDGKEGERIDRSSLSRSQGLYDAFSGKYPTFEEAFLSHLSVPLGQEAEVAISRDIALKRSAVGVTFVYYRRDMVGWMEPGSMKINVVQSDLGWVVERYLKRLKIV